MFLGDVVLKTSDFIGNTFDNEEMKAYLQQFELLSKPELEMKGISISSSFPVICDDAIKFSLEVLLKRLQPGIISDRRKEVQHLLLTSGPTGSGKVIIYHSTFFFSSSSFFTFNINVTYVSFFLCRLFF